MLDFLQGKIKQAEPAFLVLTVGGMGFYMRISLNTYAGLKDKQIDVTIHTHLHYSQTDGFSLFGFLEKAERNLFMHLISVSGVGPNTALVALSSTSPDMLRQSIMEGDVRAIQSLKGIGPKTAQRLILELKDKLRKEAGNVYTVAGSGPRPSSDSKEDALSALSTLGIPRASSEKVLDGILRQADKTYTTEELIRMVLQRSA
jgi:Holliday junction DNA helicase RuvA